GFLDFAAIKLGSISCDRVSSFFRFFSCPLLPTLRPPFTTPFTSPFTSPFTVGEGSFLLFMLIYPLVLFVLGLPTIPFFIFLSCLHELSALFRSFQPPCLTPQIYSQPL